MSLFKKIFEKNNSKEEETLTPSNKTISEEEQLKIDYPYHVSNTHLSFHAADAIVSKYNLIENVNYVRCIEHNNMAYYGSSSSVVRFNDKAIYDEIIELTSRWYNVNHMISGYDKYIDSTYHSEIFKAKNKLTKSISFLPKNDGFVSVISAIIKFYIKNNYDLPDVSTFKTGMLVCDEHNKRFNVFVRDEAEAAALLLEISDFIEVI
jgi:hypothetical protein